MSLVVDQTWVKNWEGPPSEEQRKTISSWLSSREKAWHPTLKAFPPFCLVRPKRPDIEGLCPFSVGVVTAYYEGGDLAVLQEPGAPWVRISPEDVEVVGFWKTLDTKTIAQLLS